MNKKYLKLFLMTIPLLFADILCAQTLPSPVNNPAQSNAATLTPEMIKNLKNTPYNDDLYKTSYQLFIYNSNIQAAYQLAMLAVEKNPNDLAWRERLAQSATWAGDYSTGMKQWLYVAQHTSDINLIKKAAADAKTLGFYDVVVQVLKIYLARYPDDTKASIELASAQNRLNQPEQALQTLAASILRHPTRDAYVLSAQIYQDIEQWDNALSVWQATNRRFGPSVESVMAEAVIYYTRRDFTEALNALKPGIPYAKASDVDFWDTLGQLAWLLNNRRLAVLAYSHNKIAPDNYQRLIALEMKTNPGVAYAYSVKGWNRFNRTDFLYTALSLGGQLRKWNDTSALLGKLSGKQLTEAQKQLFYWQAQEGMYSYYGADDLRREVLIRGVMLQPNLVQLKSDLLWMVMENGENQHIKVLMDLWYEEGYAQDPMLWHAYAEGFDALNDYDAAITMYQMHLFDDIQDNQVLIDYANLMERDQLYEEAYYVRLVIWQRVVNKLKTSPHDQEAIETLCQVAPFFVSGTDQVQFITDLLQLDVTDEDVNIILNWIVQRSYTDLIAYFKANYFNNRPLPDWAEINLALAKNDTPDLQRILAHTERQWTRGDRINAAVRMENIPLALDYAFNELTERPRASEIYGEFQQYGVQDANDISVDEDYEQFVDVAGLRTKFDARYRLTNEWKILPYASVWTLRSTDTKSIINVPSTDTQVGARFYQVIHRGSITYSLGYRKALGSVVPAAVDVNYQLNSRWSADFKLGYDQESFENSFLREGGVQDIAGVALGYTYNNYNSLFMEADALAYFSQDQHYLADGLDLSGMYQHKFWLEYPDYTAGLFADVHAFDRNGSFGGDVTRLFPLIPPSQQTNPASSNYGNLISNTYYDAGLNVSVGNTILEYTHAWRPYAWGSVYYNSITKLSYDVKGGVNGTVFGRDSLLFYGEYGTAQTTPGQKNITVGMRYLLYF